MDRRSLRRTPRKKYNVDVFEGIEAIDGSSDDEQRSKSGPNNNDSDSGDEFRAQDDEEDIDMDDGSAQDETAESSNSSEGATDDEDDDNKVNKIVDSRPVGSRPPRKHKKWKPPVIDPGTRLTRGVLFGERNFSGASSKETRRRLLFGSSHEDYTSVRNALARWPRHPCKPSRLSSSNNTGGFARSLEHKGEDCEGSDTDWKWLVDFGHKAFVAKQMFQPLSQSQALKFMVDSQTASTNVLLGPKDDYKFFRIDLGMSVALKVAWPDVCASEGTQARTGYVLNLGSKVQCLEWAPNQTSSPQYLAVAVIASHDSRSDIEASPFVPGPACESSIQIWELNANSDASGNDKTPPKLRMVICATWGEIRALKWCPVTSTDSSRLGLLASVWGDGGARVLDIMTPPSDGVTYEECQHAAFAEHPPDTVFTCITWLSSSLLAAGCANGYVAVYDLAGLTPDKDHLRPIIYIPTSTTYISSIDSAWPSHPHILLSTSMNGLMFMTDLRQPQPGGPGATVTSQRVRSGTNFFIWSDYAQCALSVDDSSSVRCHPLRRFFSTMTVARARSITTSIASSRCHPYVLVGTAGGEVVAFNPVPRTMNKKSELWQYSWLQHEWRRPTAAEESFDHNPGPSQRSSDLENSSTAAFSKSDNHLPDIRLGGLSRISDGPLTERIILHEDNVRQESKVGANHTTIFEEKTAVTALSWNPNLHVGGWAAVGMCDGLVYIEDISLR